MKDFKCRVWDFTDKKMIYLKGVFNEKPSTETPTFAQYESMPKTHKLSDPMLFVGRDKMGNELYEMDITETDILGHRKETHVIEDIREIHSTNSETYEALGPYGYCLKLGNAYQAPELIPKGEG